MDLLGQSFRNHCIMILYRYCDKDTSQIIIEYIGVYNFKNKFYCNYTMTRFPHTNIFRICQNDRDFYLLNGASDRQQRNRVFNVAVYSIPKNLNKNTIDEKKNNVADVDTDTIITTKLKRQIRFNSIDNLSVSNLIISRKHNLIIVVTHYEEIVAFSTRKGKLLYKFEQQNKKKHISNNSLVLSDDERELYISNLQSSFIIVFDTVSGRYKKQIELKCDKKASYTNIYIAWLLCKQMLLILEC